VFIGRGEQGRKDWGGRGHGIVSSTGHIDPARAAVGIYLASAQNLGL